MSRIMLSAPISQQPPSAEPLHYSEVFKKADERTCRFYFNYSLYYHDQAVIMFISVFTESKDFRFSLHKPSCKLKKKKTKLQNPKNVTIVLL